MACRSRLRAEITAPTSVAATPARPTTAGGPTRTEGKTASGGLITASRPPNAPTLNAELTTKTTLASGTDDPQVQVQLRWFTDHQVAAGVSGFAAACCSVLILLFATGLRQALRSGEPGESTYSSVAALGFVNDFSWTPWVASAAVLYLASGLGGLRTAALPKWLAIVSIVLGVLCLTGPAGAAVFMVTPL